MNLINGDFPCDIGDSFSLLPQSIKDLFFEDSSVSGNYILRSKEGIVCNDVSFRIVLRFKEERVNSIVMVALREQQTEKYSCYDTADELHRAWLIDNYGKPDVIEQWGLVYYLEDKKLYSYYDPRSGSAEIYYSEA